MGKLIVIAMTSFDGYYEGPAGAGDMEPLGVDDGFNAYNASVVERAGTIVIGHSSFRDFSSYWPDRESAADASDAEKRFARAYNPLPKVAVSHDPDSVEVPAAWSEVVSVVSDDVYTEVTRLREQSDADVLIWGSRTLWTRLLGAGLVDEMHVVAGTGIAGGGTPLFDSGVDVALEPLESRLLPDSNCVLTTYGVRRGILRTEDI